MRLIRWDGALRGGERLSVARAAVYTEARLLAEHRPAIWAGVEQPSGVNRNMALSYMAGVIQEAIATALSHHWGSPVAVHTVNSVNWKPAAGFSAKLGKPNKKKLGREPVLEDYPIFAWARELCPEVASWDDADAIGVTDYTRKKVLESVATATS